MTLTYKPALPFPDRPNLPQQTQTHPPLHTHTHIYIWAHHSLSGLCVFVSLSDTLPVCLCLHRCSNKHLDPALNWTTYPCSTLSLLSNSAQRHSEKTISLFLCLAFCGPASQVCIALGPWQDSQFERNKGRKSRKGAPLCLIPPLFAARGRGVVFTEDGLMDWDFYLHSLPIHTTLCQQKGCFACVCVYVHTCWRGSG